MHEPREARGQRRLANLAAEDRGCAVPLERGGVPLRREAVEAWLAGRPVLEDDLGGRQHLDAAGLREQAHVEVAALDVCLGEDRAPHAACALDQKLLERDSARLDHGRVVDRDRGVFPDRLQDPAPRDARGLGSGLDPVGRRQARGAQPALRLELVRGGADRGAAPAREGDAERLEPARHEVDLLRDAFEALDQVHDQLGALGAQLRREPVEVGARLEAYAVVAQLGQQIGHDLGLQQHILLVDARIRRDAIVDDRDLHAREEASAPFCWRRRFGSGRAARSRRRAAAASTMAAINAS
jgi:hypothetical protein